MLDDLHDLLDQLRREIDRFAGQFSSCERSNDRDGLFYYAGKWTAYICVYEVLSEILDSDAVIAEHRLRND